jgi:hypothetical protein
MFTRRFALIAFGAAVLDLAVAPAGDAASLALKTNHLTFNGAVALPGVTLHAGGIRSKSSNCIPTSFAS